MTVRVLLVDDERLVREALDLLLGQFADIEVVAVAANADEALQRAAATRPDVVLMDIRMPGRDGIAATRDLLAAHPDVAVLALTTHGDAATVLAAVHAGVSGFATKDVAADELHAAVLGVARGEVRLDPAAQHTVLRQLRGAMVNEGGNATTTSTTATSVLPPDGLTVREAEVLALVGLGLDNRGIARAMGVGGSTVKSHLHRAYAKAGLERRGQAVLYARQHGLTFPWA